MAAPSEARIFQSSLIAAAKTIGQECAEVNEQFLLCKAHDADPAKCLVQGEAVSKCVHALFSKIDGSCKEPFNAFSSCLVYNNMEYRHCRREESAFNKCWEEQ